MLFIIATITRYYDNYHDNSVVSITAADLVTTSSLDPLIEYNRLHKLSIATVLLIVVLWLGYS